MLLIQALFILLSERGFSRKRPNMFSFQLAHLIHVLKFVSSDLLASKAPYKNDQVQNFR